MAAFAHRIPAAAPAPTTGFFRSPAVLFDAMVSTYRAWTAAEDMKAIDDRLLADAGIDPAAVGKVPEDEVRTRLMMRLMSCR